MTRLYAWALRLFQPLGITRAPWLCDVWPT